MRAFFVANVSTIGEPTKSLNAMASRSRKHQWNSDTTASHGLRSTVNRKYLAHTSGPSSRRTMAAGMWL